MVYDASAQSNPQAPSLNDCLYAGPLLQNRLWNALVRMCFYPVLITEDLKQAFLQVRIKKQERDALQFHWKANEHSELETLRFTRVFFRLVPSPFLLGRVIESHLESWEPRRPEQVAELRKSLYVADLISGKSTVEETKQVKDNSSYSFFQILLKTEGQIQQPKLLRSAMMIYSHIYMRSSRYAPQSLQQAVNVKEVQVLYGDCIHITGHAWAKKGYRPSH